MSVTRIHRTAYDSMSRQGGNMTTTRNMTSSIEMPIIMPIARKTMSSTIPTRMITIRKNSEGLGYGE